MNIYFVMKYMKRAREWAKENLKQHVVDTTAILAESTPIFAAYETALAGMSDEVSINARLIAAGLGYVGFGSLLTRGRDLWRSKFNITDETKEKIQVLHDTLYLGAFNLVGGPLLYYASGSRDPKEIAIGTALAIGVGSVNGAPLGYAVDTFRDLIGLKECNRESYPNIVKKQSSRVKKGIAAGLVAASIGATAGIYGLTSDDKQDLSYNQPQTTLEETSQINPGNGLEAKVSL